MPRFAAILMPELHPENSRRSNGRTCPVVNSRPPRPLRRSTKSSAACARAGTRSSPFSPDLRPSQLPTSTRISTARRGALLRMSSARQTAFRASRVSPAPARPRRSPSSAALLNLRDIRSKALLQPRAPRASSARLASRPERCKDSLPEGNRRRLLSRSISTLWMNRALPAPTRCASFSPVSLLRTVCC